MVGRASLVLLPLLLAVGLHWVHLHADELAQAWFPAPPAFAQPRSGNGAAAPSAAPAAPAARVAASEPARPPAAPPPAAPLLGDEWTSATVDHLLAGQTELQLDPDEAERLKDVYVYCQHVRTAYEAEIAEVLSITADRARIRIPPYPEAGARLQQMWEEELSAELGASRSAEVDEALGGSFDVAFKLFGAGAQLLEVDLLEQQGTGLVYRILSRLDFADTSQPELGMNDSRLFTTTATYVLKPETVATGEWRPLAKHFPRLLDPEEGQSEPSR